MTTTEVLQTLQSAWLVEITDKFSQADSVRESFCHQMNVFFDLLLQASATADPTVLEPLIENWARSRPEVDLDNIEFSVAFFIEQVLLHTTHFVTQTLDAQNAVEVLIILIPLFTHCMQHASEFEATIHMNQTREELNKTRLTIERLEKSKSDFISVAAHELKTPLTLIEGYASMLPEAMPIEPGIPQANLLLSGIKTGTKRLREIVDDMIDVSLIDNNLLSLNFQPLWLNRLFALLKRELSSTLEQRHLTLNIIEFDGSDELLFADGERLLQAFRNVVTNAIKYTPDDGSVTISGRLLPGFIETIIQDTGIGIDFENQSRIFGKFGSLGSVSLHSSGKTKYKGGGPGLGLPITKGIIEAHGGAIWVESEGYDESRLPGSVFHILLPIRKCPPDEEIAKLFRPLIDERLSEIN